MKAPGHVMILASAGSGKTYALTNRYIALLAGGAAPERIVALTFTRKAAGEFFDEILKKLARAAGDAAEAVKLAREIGAPAEPEDFLRLLRAVVDAMPRLCLGTLDSFFTRVVRSFPLELGLGGEFALLESAAAQLERRRVLARLFSAAEGGPGAAQREFIEAFKRATFGAEEKRLTGKLDVFLDAHAETYLDAPHAACWGEARRIWPDGNVWLDAAETREAAAKALRAALPWETLGDKQRARLEDFFAALPEWSPGAPLPKPVEYLVGNAFKVWDGLRAGRAELMLERKKVSLSPAASAALVAVVAGIGGAELARRLAMTRGIFDVLHGYESVYHDAVRRGGRLTFADITRVLLPFALARGADAQDTGVRRRESGEEGGRLLIDWRLDAQFDHWLLDEFQDTSFAQWSVLRNLIDEAVQDAEGRRSFFYVGDVKQAIFAWREGDSRLFREIFDHYNAASPGAIEEQHLTKSFRSGPPVIAMVNRVLGDQAALRALLPTEAAARWSREWRAHTSAREKLGGYAELRHAEDEAGRFAETLKILREAEPQARGLTAAVLVQKNDTAARLADYLRREGGLAAVAESDLHVATDNPLTCALLALLRAAAHPGDTFAQEHLRMTPLGEALRVENLSTPDALTRRVLVGLHEEGFAGTIEKWLRALGPSLAAEDEFSRTRGRQLVELAREFDEGGRRDVAEFLALAEAHTARDADAAGTVRVMTVHKAKGLGFDLVILPDLEGQSLAQRRDGLAVHKNAEREVEWILDLPARVFREHDPVLAAHVAGEEADAAYEAMCKLYVAMTRAKRAMYVITTRSKETSSSNNFPKLLRETLGEQWSDGDARWFDAVARVGEELRVGSQDTGAEHDGLEPLAGAPGAARLVARRPSGEKRSTVDGAVLFALTGAAGAEFGTTVHALLAEVGWGGVEEAERLESEWRERGEDVAAREIALACVGAPGLAGVWARPDAGAEVWRERAFEVVLDGRWVTGVFDRVVIDRDATGVARGATVFDFKTDAAPDAARHAGQMGLYRRAAARLLGLPEEVVRSDLVFTATRERAGGP
jgi:ATP-dependent exoDNAse (exonuclease V) beta subunit